MELYRDITETFFHTWSSHQQVTIILAHWSECYMLVLVSNTVQKEIKGADANEKILNIIERLLR